MKHQIATLSGAHLDAAVAKAEGLDYSVCGEEDGMQPQVLVKDWPGDCFSPTSFWADGGPIIERERIDLEHGSNQGEDFDWRASAPTSQGMTDWHEGETPLMAAMRAYVASKFGEEVELPC